MPPMSIITKALAVFCLLTVSAVTPPDPGELVSVFGEGTAIVTGQNYVLARNVAQKKALKHALLNVLRVFLSQEQIEAKEEFIEQNVISIGMNFVQSYRFVNEGLRLDELTEYEAYFVNMEYTFFVTYLGEELSKAGLKVSGTQKTKVLLVIEEQTLGVVQGPGFLILPSATEKSIKEAITAEGYLVIDRREIRKLDNNRRVMLALKGEKIAIKWLASKFKADYVLLGTAKSENRPARRNLPPYVEGIVEAKIYDGYTANVIWEERVVVPVKGGGGASSFKSIRLATEQFKRKVIDFLGSSMRF